jgi:hypothetical protein
MKNNTLVFVKIFINSNIAVVIFMLAANVLQLQEVGAY